MSAPVITAGRSPVPEKADPGQRLAIASLLMVPALLVTFVTAFFIGTAVQSALGLADDEMLKDAGAWGVLAAVFLIALIALPQIVGIVLGLKARRLGEHRLGTVGVVVNAVIGAFFLLNPVLSLLFG